jgi:S-adenosylmethionine synthetase
MVGFACDETKEFMPTPISLAHNLTRRLADARKKKMFFPILGPTGNPRSPWNTKTAPCRIDAVVMSSQHDRVHPGPVGKKITNASREEMIEKIVLPVLPKNMLDKQDEVLCEPHRQIRGGRPEGDTGVTGRKIIVDTYGGWAPHGGGAFSGKDPTKVDRSACYMARHVAKNIVAAGVGQAMHGSVGVRHWRGRSGQRDGGYPRNGPGAGIETGGTRSRCLPFDTAGHHRLSQTASAVL